MKKKSLLLILALLSLSLIVAACGGNNAEKAIPEAQKAEGELSEDTGLGDEDTPVTYENFVNIQMGSDTAAAEELFGPGEKLEGIEGSDIYTWQGQGIGNMVLIFSDDKVIEKSQTDLAERSAEINAEQAAAITEGMTVADAEALLGQATLISQRLEEDGTSSQTYEWKNPNGSVLTVTAIDNRITSVMPVGLE